MCLITRQSKPVVLKNDITVYKLLIPRTYCSARSHFFPRTYLYEECYKTEITINCMGSDIAWWDEKVSKEYQLLKKETDPLKKIDDSLKGISSGFHWATSLERFNKPINGDLEIFECTVSAGSEIYFDDTGLGVSNQIIVHKIINRT